MKLLSRTEALLVSITILVFGIAVIPRLIANNGSLVEHPKVIARSLLAPVSLSLYEGKGGWTVYQVTDYQCPPCHQSEAISMKIRAQFPDVEWRVVHFPLAKHQFAFELALAAEIAGEAGEFKKFHAALANAPMIRETSVRAYLSRVGPNLVRFSGNPKSEQAKRLKTKIFKAKKLSVEGTPSFFVFGPNGTNFATYNANEVSRVLAGDTKGLPVGSDGCGDDEGC